LNRETVDIETGELGAEANSSLHIADATPFSRPKRCVIWTSRRLNYWMGWGKAQIKPVEIRGIMGETRISLKEQFGELRISTSMMRRQRSRSKR